MTSHCASTTKVEVTSQGKERLKRKAFKRPQKTGIQGAYRRQKVLFHDIPGPFMSIFHVFSGLFNPVDIEQVRFSHNTENVTQFIIILNNRSNGV